VAGKPASIDEYLAAVRMDQRAALEKLRAQIHAAAPGAEECISYSLPAFRLAGKLLVGFGASSRHCSLYPMSGTTVASLAEALVGFETSKGSIHFTPGKPLPAALVRKVIKARMVEIAG